MSCNWMRRALLALASVSLLSLAACGAGTIESQLQPSRVISVGDGFSDLGQGGTRYTVNDGSINIWAQTVANRFGLNLVTVAAGGTSYATGNVRIVIKPDAAGSSAKPTVAEQIDAFLATGPIGTNDLVLVSGGTADIIAEMAKVRSGAQTSDQLLANVRQAGRDLAAQVRRLVQAGGTHVVVAGVYNLGRTPWAASIGQVTLLTEASTKFNEELLIAMVDLGDQVLYVDTALTFNQMSISPGSFALVNSADAVCTSVDPGPGIGIGAGEVNSALCTTATILAGATYTQYLFADKVYPAPEAHRRFGEFAYSKIRSRW